MEKTAVVSVVLSGEAVRDHIENGSLEEVWRRIGSRLAAENQAGMRIGRRTVVLGPKLWDSSRGCLEAGFEVIPARNEDYRAAVEILRGAFDREFDEIAFVLDGDPIPLLQCMPQGVRKTWIRKMDDERIAEIRCWCDAVVDLPALEGPPDAPCSIPSRSPEPSRESREAVVAELETILTAEGFRVEFDRLRRLLSRTFPRLPTRLDEFRREILSILPDHVRYIPGEEGGTLIHERDPSFKPVPVGEAVQRLTLGASKEPIPAESDETGDAPRRVCMEEIPPQAELLAAQLRWMKQRASLAGEVGVDATSLSEKDEEFKRRGKEIGVFLWPIWHELPDDAFVPLSECYRALAEGFSFLAEIDRDEKTAVRNGFFDKAAQLAAIILCALKTLLLDNDLTTTTCRVQKEAFGLLREIAAKRHVWLDFMRATDRVEREQFLTTVEELGRMRREFRLVKTRTRTKQELLRKCGYHLGKLKDSPDPRHDWQVIIESVTELVTRHHVPESSLEFRELLEAHAQALDAIPEEMETSPEFGRVVQNIELHLEQRAAESEATRDVAICESAPLTPAIRAVRTRFRDSRVVFVGGTPAAHVQHRIQEAFHVDLAWPEARHSDSLDRHFRGYLEDERTRLFLVYIPWCSHAHSRELGQMVKQTGKDFVRLKSGTNPASIALAVCEQLGLETDQ